MDAIARSKRQDSKRRRNSMPVSPEPLAVGNVTMVSRLADAEDPFLVQAWANSERKVSTPTQLQCRMGKDDCRRCLEVNRDKPVDHSPMSIGDICYCPKIPASDLQRYTERDNEVTDKAHLKRKGHSPNNLEATMGSPLW